MNVLIAGNGKMQKLFAHRLTQEFEHTVTKWGEDKIEDPEYTVALHVGSGRELEGLMTTCEALGVPILQGSTGMQKFDGYKGLIVHANNFALPILSVIKLLSAFNRELCQKHSLLCDLVESHQSTKKGVPGTAQQMAAELEIPKEDIVSIRDRKIQLSMGVPIANLDAHGYHWINWFGLGVKVELNVKVNGRDAYLYGGEYLLRILHNRRHERGSHDVIKFLNL